MGRWPDKVQKLFNPNVWNQTHVRSGHEMLLYLWFESRTFRYYMNVNTIHTLMGLSAEGFTFRDVIISSAFKVILTRQ